MSGNPYQYGDLYGGLYLNPKDGPLTIRDKPFAALLILLTKALEANPGLVVKADENEVRALMQSGRWPALVSICRLSIDNTIYEARALPKEQPKVARLMDLES